MSTNLMFMFAAHFEILKWGLICEYFRLWWCQTFIVWIHLYYCECMRLKNERDLSVCLLWSKCHIWIDLKKVWRVFQNILWTVAMSGWWITVVECKYFHICFKNVKGEVKNLNRFLMGLSKHFVLAGDLKTNSH